MMTTAAASNIKRAQDVREGENRGEGNRSGRKSSKPEIYGIFGRTGQIDNGMKVTFAEPEPRAEQHANQRQY